MQIVGDSDNNEFVSNALDGGGYRFEDQSGAPNDNLVTGGTVANAGNCLRFISSSNNTLEDIALSNCGDDVESEGNSDNTLIGITFDTGSFIFNDANSSLAIGWHLDVAIRDANMTPINTARAQLFNSSSTELFNLLTDSSGNITQQDIIEYTKTSAGSTFNTPLSLTSTKDGF